MRLFPLLVRLIGSKRLELDLIRSGSGLRMCPVPGICCQQDSGSQQCGMQPTADPRSAGSWVEVRVVQVWVVQEKDAVRREIDQ